VWTQSSFRRCTTLHRFNDQTNSAHENAGADSAREYAGADSTREYAGACQAIDSCCKMVGRNRPGRDVTPLRTPTTNRLHSAEEVSRRASSLTQRTCGMPQLSRLSASRNHQDSPRNLSNPLNVVDENHTW